MEWINFKIKNKNMDTPLKQYFLSMIETLKKYAEDKKKEGFIPTIEMLIEDLENQMKKYD